MIVFDLICPGKHRFEGWFASSETFERQRERGLIGCPQCGASEVSKLPGSKIKRSEAERPASPAAAPPPPAAPVKSAAEVAALPTAAQRAQLLALIEQVMKNTENVGAKFAEEARKIHYQETPERAIRGIATADETRELLEEGIPVLPLPLPPPSELH